MADDFADFGLQDINKEYKAETAGFVQGLLDRNKDCKSKPSDLRSEGIDHFAKEYIEPWRGASPQGINDVYAVRVGDIKALAEHIVDVSCSAGPMCPSSSSSCFLLLLPPLATSSGCPSLLLLLATAVSFFKTSI